MLLIGEILVSEDLLEEHFACQLDACKGACCWEGDFGAPLEQEEMEVLEQLLPVIRPGMPGESRELLDREGPFRYYPEKAMTGTSLHASGACVFLNIDEAGIAKCGIEQAWEEGRIPFRKPVSCHLYPVRVTKNTAAGFEALNYDRWDICSAACSHGEALGLPLYRFVKDALIRKYGEEFYSELDDVASQWNEKSPSG